MMTDREIKKMLKDAYTMDVSDREKTFVRRYEHRRKQFFDIFRIELGHMKMGSCLGGIALYIALFYVLQSGKENVMWMLSSMLPLLIVAPLVALKQSDKYGMSEVEAASRFSLRFIKMTQMLILGLASILILMVSTICLHGICRIGISQILFYVAFPYLFNVSGSLYIFRKWHTKENIYACIALAGLSVVLPAVLQVIRLHTYIPEYAVVVLFILVFYASGREIILFVKESENISWNLC